MLLCVKWSNPCELADVRAELTNQIWGTICAVTAGCGGPTSRTTLLDSETVNASIARHSMPEGSDRLPRRLV